MMRLVYIFLRLAAFDWVVWMSGFFGVVFWFVGAAFSDASVSLKWGFWVCGALALLVAAFSVWRRQYDATQVLEDRLRVNLTIDGVTQRSNAHCRVRVRNLSDAPVEFIARLESITGGVSYALPVALQHTHHDPQKTAWIPARGESLVDVFLDNTPHNLQLLLMGNPPAAIPIAVQHYTLVICVFSTSPPGPSVRRRFYIIPQQGGGMIFGDGGPVLWAV